MIGLFWNVRGVGSSRAFCKLYKVVQSTKPQFVFLSETKSRKDRLEFVKRQLGFYGYVSVDCEGKSGRLALLWVRDFEFQLISFSSSHIDGWVSYGNLQ